MQIDNDDFYIDPLFYTASCGRLVAIELRVGDFRAEYMARWSSTCAAMPATRTGPTKNLPLGIIPVHRQEAGADRTAGTRQERIHVAEYPTVLPSREALRPLHESIVSGRGRACWKTRGTHERATSVR